MTKHDRDTRIAIVGAGPAGLTAAYMLKKRGYKNITIIEKDDHPGGKCRTILFEDRYYELGAGIHTFAYRTVKEIMRHTGEKGSFIFDAVFLNLAEGTAKRLATTLYLLRTIPFSIPGLRFLFQLIRNFKIYGPGLKGINRELHTDFDKWTQKRKLQRIAERISVFHTGFGYGYFDETPTAYVLKYISIIWFFTKGLNETGFQGIWDKLAVEFDLLLSRNIQSITRGTVITIKTDREELQVDRLILACPLDETLNFMDASEEEKELFSKIRYYDFHVYLARAENMPEGTYALINDRQKPVNTGHLMFWYHRWKDTGIYSFYSLGKSSYGMKEITDSSMIKENIIKDVGLAGGTINEFCLEKLWKYFPHVTPEEMDAGFYDRIEAIQGSNNTYYTGEIMNFSTVETVARYSKSLVKRFFP